MGKGMRAGKVKKPASQGGNMQQKMQALNLMQQKIEETQSLIEQKEIQTTAGGGVVTVTMNGKKEITKLELKPEIVDPDDIETLQDLVMAAVNEGIRQIEEISNEEMSKVTGGLGIPGL